MTSARPPDDEGVTFGRVVPPVPERSPAPRPPSADAEAGHPDEVAELIRRAGSLTTIQVRQLAAAASWRWLPLGLPSGGTVAAARAAAIGAGRQAGRGAAIEAAQDRARHAAIGSLGSTASEPVRLGAEGALLAVVLGVAGAAVGATAGETLVSILFAILAVVGAVALLFLESAYVRRIRLLQAVSSAALGAVTRDLIEPETYELLAGPWLSVMRD
jgi:hypothetical protein